MKYLVTIFNFKDGGIKAEYHTKSSSPSKAIANILVNYRTDDPIKNMTCEDVVQAQIVED